MNRQFVFFSLACAMLLIGIIPGSIAQAHYLWIKVPAKGSKTGSAKVANIYFEHSASPGDGHYLDPFLKTKTTWIRTVEKINPQVLPLVEKKAGEDKRWVVVKLPEGAPRSLESYWKFGVYRYGKTDVLLHYYARQLEVDSHEDLHELSRAKHMNLDIIPHDFANQMELAVIWKGKPIKNRMVHILGPKGFRLNKKTGERGKVSFEIKEPGEYSFRTSFEEDKSGKENGKAYSEVRHHATLIMSLPLSK